MTEPPNPPDEKSLRETRKLLLDVLRGQVNSQDKQFDSLRTASSILLAAAGVVLTQIARTDLESGHPLLTWLVFLGAVASAVAALAAILAAMPATLHRHPRPEGLVERHYNSPVDEVENQLITELKESYHRSEPVTAGMARSLRLSAYSLGLAVLLLLFAAVVKWSVQAAPERSNMPLRVTISATSVDTIVHVPASVETLTSQGRKSP